MIAACAEEPRQWPREIEHCATTAGRATESYGDITIIGVRHWVLEDVRSVQLRFSYPPENPDFKVGVILCAYDFGLDVRADPDRIVKAKSVYFKGRYLSEGELEFLNTSLFRPRPEFKIEP